MRASNLTVESYWPSLFAKLAEKRNLDDLIMNVGAGGGAAASPAAVSAPSGGAGGAGAAPPPEEKKVSKTSLIILVGGKFFYFYLNFECGFIYMWVFFFYI